MQLPLEKMQASSAKRIHPWSYIIIKLVEKKVRHEGGLSCPLIDGKVDESKVMLEVESINRTFPGLIKREHCTVFSESIDQFMFPLYRKKHAERFANTLYWLQERGLENSMQIVGGDSTAVELTGREVQ